MKIAKKVMIMAGGTGGHVYPALAVAHYLREKGVSIHWLGTKAGIEAEVVPPHFPISYIDIQGLFRTKIINWILLPWKLTKATLQSLRIFLKERPDVVLSMGGYASGPGALAAFLCRCPVIVHEQNAIPGWTNRILAQLAKRILVAFPHVFSNKKDKVVLTGNPVRSDILRPSPALTGTLSRQAGEGITLLVLGGSQGAAKLNEIVPAALALIPQEKRPLITHQTGKSKLNKTKENYALNNVEANITDYIEDMGNAYANADIVICRSGALTVSELANVGVASILIPFPHAVNNHQMFNAKYLSDKGGAILLEQSHLTPENLQKLLLELINNPEKRLTMAKTCKTLAKPNATHRVAEICLEVAHVA